MSTESATHEERHGSFTRNLAQNLLHQGDGRDALGQLTEGLAAYDDAVKLLGVSVELENRKDLLDILAEAHLKKGTILAKSGQHLKALTSYESASFIFARLIESGRTERALAEQLATAFNNRALVLKDLGEMQEADACREAATGILQSLGKERLPT